MKLDRRYYRFALPIALVGGCLGTLAWFFIGDSNPGRLLEFGIWTGFATMAPGLLVAQGASDNSFEEGEGYDAMRDASQKQERISSALPILTNFLLAGTLIITLSFALKLFITNQF